MRRVPGFSFGVWFVGVGLLAGVACDTVDLGDPPADVNSCRPDRQFFYTDVWPKFLAKDYGDKRCNDSRCHDAGSSRQLVLTPPTSAPGLPLPADWDAVYKSVTAQMSCTNVASSALLVHPDGRRVHGGGKLIELDGPEEQLIKEWVNRKK